MAASLISIKSIGNISDFSLSGMTPELKASLNRQYDDNYLSYLIFRMISYPKFRSNTDIPHEKDLMSFLLSLNKRDTTFINNLSFALNIWITSYLITLGGSNKVLKDSVLKQKFLDAAKGGYGENLGLNTSFKKYLFDNWRTMKMPLEKDNFNLRLWREIEKKYPSNSQNYIRLKNHIYEEKYINDNYNGTSLSSKEKDILSDILDDETNFNLLIEYFCIKQLNLLNYTDISWILKDMDSVSQITNREMDNLQDNYNSDAGEYTGEYEPETSFWEDNKIFIIGIIIVVIIILLNKKKKQIK